MSEREQYDNEVVDLFCEHRGVMEGFLIRRGVPRQVAEEIVNDVFAALRLRWDRLRHENCMAYAYRIATNECNKWWRQEGQHEERRLHGDFDVPDDRDEYQEIVNRIYLGQALQELSPRERETVLRRFINQRSVKETADDMGVSEGAVKGYTRDALRKLQEKADGQITSSGEEQ
ncbi:sigma-70 family RNA polymerase sigma factor [Streptomyces sp. NPDC046909]|uniref:RNA polymerase sigma factor n=1 Tax=Streptomyces sp. NPDC046909 TaxID=3155617 RepID=UPI0033E5EF41